MRRDDPQVIEMEITGGTVSFYSGNALDHRGYGMDGAAFCDCGEAHHERSCPRC